MTGTSMDAIDAVAVQIHGHGLSMKTKFIGMESESIEHLQKRLRVVTTGNCDALEMDSLGLEIGKLTAKCIAQLGVTDIDLIAIHGQTVWHKPPESIQLIDPTPIVEQCNCTVVTDPRQSDLQNGGQGAPITPLADWILFQSNERNTAVVNLGGFCNITLLPKNGQPSDLQGFDLCCCNLLLDAIARDRLQTPFDRDGCSALSGAMNQSLFEELKSKLQQQHAENRSLGTSDDLSAWILERSQAIDTNDLLFTATNAIGEMIQEAVADADKVLLAGGGVHNPALMQAIGCRAKPTDAMGVPTQAREAMAMAILGALAEDGVSITLPHITGRRETTEVIGWVQASP